MRTKLRASEVKHKLFEEIFETGNENIFREFIKKEMEKLLWQKNSIHQLADG